MLLQEFISAIRSKNKIRVTFYSKKDQEELTRVCAPMDYGQSRVYKDGKDRFFLWDYDSDAGAHTLSILPEQVINMQFLEECFEPSGFVTWKPNWIVSRDW